MRAARKRTKCQSCPDSQRLSQDGGLNDGRDVDSRDGSHRDKGTAASVDDQFPRQLPLPPVEITIIVLVSSAELIEMIMSRLILSVRSSDTYDRDSSDTAG